MINPTTICRHLVISLMLLGSGSLFGQVLSPSYSGASSGLSGRFPSPELGRVGWNQWGDWPSGLTRVQPLPPPAPLQHSPHVDQLNRLRYQLDREQQFRQAQWHQQRQLEDRIRLLQEQQRFQRENFRQQLEWHHLNSRRFLP
jgi:hypothetical protein